MEERPDKQLWDNQIVRRPQAQRILSVQGFPFVFMAGLYHVTAHRKNNAFLSVHAWKLREEH